MAAAAGGGGGGGNQAESPVIEILLKGTKIDEKHYQGYIIETDVNQPDMAAIILTNQDDAYSASTEMETEVEVKFGTAGTTIFKGEVVGLEPIFKGGEKSRIVIRAMNKMHRLLRKRKSRTFVEKTDKEIIETCLGDAGLTLEFTHDSSITYKHVYQHNQTDLEFIRVRAARIGCHVWCEDQKVIVKQLKTDDDAGVSYKIDSSGEATGNVMSFNPRLSTAQVVKKVTVRGWNPETKELIVGDQSVETSRLGSQNASEFSKTLGGEETFTVDHPIWSQDEAKVLAKARIKDLNMTFITGTLQAHSVDAAVKVGKTVTIEANGNDNNDPFNGKYYVQGITYRYQPSQKEHSDKKDTAHSVLKLARDAAKK
ncbi:MAG TPA: phage late control D family protein [Kofleriaceae bacterium]|jgi:phage protein D